MQEMAITPYIHELFRGYSLGRDYNYHPHLPEQVRSQLQDSSLSEKRVISSLEEGDVAERQKHYDQQRQTRDRAMRELQIAFRRESIMLEPFQYESDF